jgi:predicted PurR-regulated permease PerM
MARLISTSVLLTLIVVLGITFFRVIAPFLLPLFLAGVVALLCQPLFRYFLDRTNGRVRWSAGFTTACVVAAVLIPLVAATIMASVQTFRFAASIADPRAWTELLAAAGADPAETPESPWHAAANLANRFLPAGRQTTPEDVETLVRVKLRDAFNELGNRSLGIAGTTIDALTAVLARLTSIVLGILIFVIALYYFFADGTALIRASEKLIPVHVEYQRELLNEFATVVRSVVSATFLSALAQALATVAALWVCGFDHLLILFVLAAIASLVPLAGSWLVWGPCAVIMAVQGNVLGAVLLTIYGLGFVGILDNVIRTYVLKSDTKLHPLLAFISVMGGLQVLGLWGVFIGPIVASCLHALVRIFNHEIVELSRERFAPVLAAEAVPNASAAGNVPARARQSGSPDAHARESGESGAATGEDVRNSGEGGSGSARDEQLQDRHQQETSTPRKKGRKRRSRSKGRR